MNSLTTVGGKVIESEELSSMHDQLSRTGITTTIANNSSSSDRGKRVNSPRSQLTKKPSIMRRSTSSGNGSPNPSPVAKAKLSRHGSAPSSIVSNDDDVNKKKMTLRPSPISTRPAALQLPPRSPTFKKKVSTPNNSQAVNLLATLSRQETFHKSSYFRGVFARGIDKVKQYKYQIDTIEEALELCFDVSDDMRKVIAAKVHADEIMSTMMSPPSVVRRSNGDNNIMQGPNSVRNTNISSTRSLNNNRSKPWESSPRNKGGSQADTTEKFDLWLQLQSNNRKPKPWEGGGTNFGNRSLSVQEYMQQIEDRINFTYSDGKMDNMENKSSVSLANAALNDAVESERKGRSPFDEALVSPRLVRRKCMEQNEMISVLVSPADQTMAEHFSESEVLVKELELLEDKKRMSLELERNSNELKRQKDEIDASKVAMTEAEKAVQVLEETVRELMTAKNAKDELIGQLESKVREENVASAGEQKAHQQQVKELGSAVAQLNMLVKEKEAESKEVNARLAEAVEKNNKSEAVLKELQLNMAKKEEEHAALIQELVNERDDLTKDLEACRETMTTSLDNTTKQMDGTIKEKDKLIYSLRAKIEILESNLEDMKESKLQVDISIANKEKELNEKIHDLATTLIQKDEKMTGLEEDIEKLKMSSKKEKKSERLQHRHTKQRPWELQDEDSVSTSFESKEEHNRRQHRKSSHQRRSHDDDERAARSHKAGVPERVRYSTPELFHEERRDDGYGHGHSYPEREGALFSPIDDDSYVYRRM